MRSREDLAYDILDYLVAHPDAEDTLDGIARFWVTRQRIEVQVEQTKAVLADLVNRGYVIVSQRRETGSSGMKQTFSLDHSKLSEIERRLLFEKQRRERSARGDRGSIEGIE